MPIFEDFWAAYPARHGRKLGKALCLSIFKKLPHEDQLLVLKAAAQYAEASKPKADAFVPLPRDPIRFLKQDWWRDWVDRPEVKAVKPLITPPTPQGPGVSMREALQDWPEGLAKLERILTHGPSLSQPSRGK